MVVNSLNFLLFFSVVFIVYYLPICRNNAKIRNGWIFLVCYFFYGVADLKMIPLLFGTTIVFYALGIWLKSEMNKKHTRAASHITTLSVCLGVGVLLYFKYLNFFAESVAELLNAIGLNATWTTLNIVLPVGVSFFTFKLIGYVIEIHREHINPCKDFILFGNYIAFFPTILSGPIDRPKNLIPQLGGVKIFNYDLAVDGCRQILWGMFSKMCIADNLATITDSVWSSYSEQTGSTLLVTALLYYIQMYTDFDGYSNMAIGVGKLLGIKITRNFNHPLLARNTAEYWRRWHMSLTSWITDYVFLPLNIAFMEWRKLGVILAVMINLIVIGLWHGANWTYGLFGIYHGLLFIPLVYSGSFGKNKKLNPNAIYLPKVKDFTKMVGTFFLVSFGLIIFRAQSIIDAYSFVNIIISRSFLSIPIIKVSNYTILFITILILFEWFQKEKEYASQLDYHILEHKKWISYSVDYLLILAIVFKGNFYSNQFIYFQF